MVLGQRRNSAERMQRRRVLDVDGVDLAAGDGTLYTADQGWSDQNRYLSTDGGAHWTRAGADFARAFPAAATPYAWASSANGGVIIGGSSDTLMASSDHGATWRDVGSTQAATGGWHGNGYSGLLGTRIAFSPTQPSTVFLSAFDAGNLLRSTDGGASWTRPLNGWDSFGGGYDVQVGGTTGNVVYEILGQSGTFNGIAVSKDAGQTWSYHAGGALPARYAWGSGQASVTIASGDGSIAYAVLPNQQLYVTTDAGATWSQVALGSQALAAASSRIIEAFTSRRPPASSRSPCLVASPRRSAEARPACAAWSSRPVARSTARDRSRAASTGSGATNRARGAACRATSM